MCGRVFRILVLLIVLISLSAPVQASDLTHNIDTVADLAGVIENTEFARIVFTYQTVAGVSGNGSSIRIKMAGNNVTAHFGNVRMAGDLDDEDYMEEGPAEVVLKLQNNEVRSLSVYVGGQPARRNRSTLNLGEIPSAVAARYLIGLAWSDIPHERHELILAAVIARDGDLIEEMLDLVNDKSVDMEIRNDSLFWLAHFAGDKVIGSMKDIIYDTDEVAELRETAIYTLSRMDIDRALPLLMDLAQNRDDPQLQQAAFFGLARIDDPTVIKLFEQILLDQ